MGRTWSSVGAPGECGDEWVDVPDGLPYGHRRRRILGRLRPQGQINAIQIFQNKGMDFRK